MVTEIQIDALRAKIAGEIGYQPEMYSGILNEEVICIPAEQLRAAIRALQTNFNCFHLSTITAQQREAHSGEIELLYQFWQGKGFSLLMRLPMGAPEVASIIDLIPGADFYEREVAEMFGVTFTGRTETPRLLLPGDWDQGPPFIRNEESDE